MSSNAEHWEQVYQELPEGGGSWTRTSKRESLEAMYRVSPRQSPIVIDIGGGRDSVIWDDAQRFERAYVIDISPAALGLSESQQHQWIDVYGSNTSMCAGDVLTSTLPLVEVWHDRATMHFLTSAADRKRYVSIAADRIVPGGGIVIAGFAPTGPTHCSGLEVLRRGPEELAQEFSEYFDVVDTYETDHTTPNGVVQRFAWFLGRRK